MVGSCEPDCGSMAFQQTKSVPHLTINPPGSIPCDGEYHERAMTVEVADDAPVGTQYFELEATHGPATCSNFGNITVAGVTELVWEEYAVDSTPLDSCPNNGETRIFPDKRFVVDPSASIRRKIRLRGRIAPIVTGCTLHFRTFDVDDPFDQNFTCSSGSTPPNCVFNANLIDGDASGPDNRGTETGVVLSSVVTDANGEASVTIEVSTQPGNNYRGAASTSISRVNAMTQAMADGNVPPQSVAASDMLTVWRRVWLELDSMAAGSDISIPNGYITGQAPGVPHSGDTTLTVNVAIEDDGRFEGGTLAANGTGTAYSIIDNYGEGGFDRYVVPFPVFDDDVNDSTSIVDDDTAVLPKTPDANILVLNQKYRFAYIEFFENTATRDNTNTFLATIPATNVAISLCGLENADMIPSESHWTAIVVSAFQSFGSTDDTNSYRSSADADPDKQYHIHGASFSSGDSSVILGITPGSGENITLFFLESNIDSLRQDAAGFTGIPAQPLSFAEPQTIAHEIGHMFGLDDVGPGTLMGPYDGEDPEFDASELDAIRSSDAMSRH